MKLSPQTITTRERYKVAVGTILPRPIAWVSTRSQNGTNNLAPFSFFTVVSTNPLTLTFCPQQYNDGREKDTLHHIRENGEFVINLTDEATAEAMNITSGSYASDLSEFEIANVTPVMSETIAVPRVAEAPVAFECVLDRLIEIGTGVAVIGTVTMIHLRDEIMKDSYIEIEKLQPIGRLAGSEYARMSDRFFLERPIIK